MIFQYLIIVGAILFYKILVFLISLNLKRSDIADVSWGLSFVIAGFAAVLISGFFSLEALLTFILISVWGFRLAIRIYLRNKNKTEDFRYKEFKKKFNEDKIQILLKIFLFQGILSFLVAIPFINIILYPTKFINSFESIGMLVWLIGFVFETISDHQLDIFKKQNKNSDAILQTGLWKYSRHPNYFGEITMWWGIFLISIGNGNILLNLIGPLTITFLITKVSGIPMLEKRYKENIEFDEYKRKTSILFPLPPKR